MSPSRTPYQVDVRGPRFVAWVTTAVLIVMLLVSGFSPAAAALTAETPNATMTTAVVTHAVKRGPRTST